MQSINLIKKTKSTVSNHPYLSLVIGSMVFIVSVIILFTYSNILIYSFNPDRTAKVTGLGKGQPVLPALVQYDSGHYVAISQNGYKHDYNAAFLPLFPLSIRLTSNLIKDIKLSALMTDWIFLVFAVIIFYKFIKFEIEKHKLNISPWLVLGLLSIFPTSFYFAIPYTESLFLLLTASSFYLYRKEKYLLASLFTALASLTKYQGLVFAVFVIADILIRRKQYIRKLLPLISSGLGFLGYLVFLNIKYKNPLEFLKAEKYWGRDYGSIPMNLIHSFRPEYFWYFIILGLAIYGIYKYLDKAYLWYSVVFLLVPLSNGRLDALNRYMLTDLPIFIGLAMVVYSYSVFYKYFYMIGSGYLLSMSIMLFANGYLVA